ncbi:MAG: hypothetical protein ACRDSR_13325 [Pseudonocardiaceae bacterium]
MKSVIGGVVAPLVAFAVLTAGAPNASAAGIGESYSMTAGGVLHRGDSVTMAPQPPQLSEEEKRAIENKEAGRPYDEAAYNRAKKKQIETEKYNKERNKQKRRK